MGDWAFDSSVASKWVLPEPDTPLAQRAGDEVRAGGGRLIMLDLAVIEGANAIRTLLRRSLIDVAKANLMFGDLLALPVVLEPAQRLLPMAFDITVRYDVAVYDALFVALTSDLAISGLTADEPLWKAVRTDFPQIHLLRDWPPTAP
jgi:predicted nucleic acid-binding protein